MTTITLTVPADSTSETLTGYLRASKGWEYVLSYGKGEHWATTYYRTEGPFKGYKIDVPQHDEDPQWLADVAQVINGVDQDTMPACGLSPSAIRRAIKSIGELTRPGRTGRAGLSEAVALYSVMDPWYGAAEEAVRVLRAITRGMPLPLTGRQRTILGVLVGHLTALLAEAEHPLSAHPAMLAGEILAEPWLDCCRNEHYSDPGAAYIHTVCGGLLRTYGDVHDHRLCTCYGKSVRTAKPAQGGILTVAEIT